MGLGVGPRTGVNTVVVGDAGGLINPFNGEGIAYGYETGRLAAAFLGEALSGGGTESIAAYERRLDEIYGTYYRVGRAFVRLISDPRRMQRCVGIGMHSQWFMAQLLRIMANLMRPEVSGAAEAGYRGLVGIAATLDRLERAGISV
jgi:flavin-dependent dehydrogenase